MSHIATQKLRSILAAAAGNLPLARHEQADALGFKEPEKLARACALLEEKLTAAAFSQRPDRRIATLRLLNDIHGGRCPASEFGPGERRMLPWVLSGDDVNLAETDAFLTALRLLGEAPLRTTQLLGLVQTFLGAPKIAPGNYTPWVERIHSELAAYEGPHRKLHRWKAHRKLLFTPDSPVQVARYCLKHENGVVAGFDSLELRRASEFGSRILRAFYTLLCGAPHFPGRVMDLPQLVAAGQKKDEFARDVVREGIEALLLAYHKRPNLALPDPFGRFIFTRLGDPRQKRNPRWGAVDFQAVAVYRRWIAREDLELFFRAVAMDEARRTFWLDYVDQMENSRVALGSAAKAINQEAVHQFLKDGRAAPLDGANGTVSAFMFQIQGYDFVEFSVTGNACYVYQSSESPIFFEDERYSIRALKKEFKHWKYGAGPGRKPTNRILHQVGWQTQASQLLSDLGIHAPHSRGYW